MAPKGGKTNEWVYDELLCFVGSPLFQVPVMTFIEANCLIFDPSREDCKEYRELHGSYSALVTVLLDAFREDTTLTHDQIIKAMVEMSKKADLRQIFKGLFEHILATESFRIFVRIMTQKNIELQQQALMLIMKQLGRSPNAGSSRPASLSRGAKPQSTAAASRGGAGSSSSGAHQPSSSSSSSSSSTSASGDTSKKADTPRPSETSAASDMAQAAKAQQATPAQPLVAEAQAFRNEQEDRILEGAISAVEAQKDGERIVHGLSEAEVERTVALTEAEASLLESEKIKEEAKLVQAVQSLIIGGDSKEEAGGASVSASDSKRGASHLSSLPPLNVRSSSEAPILTLSLGVNSTADTAHQSASVEVSSAPDTTRSTFESTWGAMSADDIKKRQEFLRQQREKLLELKKREREKQLEIYEQSQTAVGGGGAAAVSRPKSSRAARAAISGSGGSFGANAIAQPAAANDAEDEKRIAMRRAIANRLKEEMFAGSR